MTEKPSSPSVTASPEADPLRKLIKSWRMRADAVLEDVSHGHAPTYELDYARAWLTCADELEPIVTSTREALTQAQQSGQAYAKAFEDERAANERLLIELTQAQRENEEWRRMNINQQGIIADFSHKLDQQAQEIARLKEEVQSYVEREAGADL